MGRDTFKWAAFGSDAADGADTGPWLQSFKADILPLTWTVLEAETWF